MIPRHDQAIFFRLILLQEARSVAIHSHCEALLFLALFDSAGRLLLILFTCVFLLREEQIVKVFISALNLIVRHLQLHLRVHQLLVNRVQLLLVRDEAAHLLMRLAVNPIVLIGGVTRIRIVNECGNLLVRKLELFKYLDLLRCSISFGTAPRIMI